MLPSRRTLLALGCPTLLAILLGSVLVDPARAEIDPAGREFWLLWPETPDITANDPTFDTDAELIVLSDSTQPVPFSVTATGLSYSGTTTRSTPARVRVPKTLKIESHEVVEDKGIHVIATDRCEPIAVLFRVPATNSSVGDDVYAALPVASLGLEYYPDTYPGDAEFAVLAVADGTTVTWDNPHCPGARSFTLNRGQTVQHRCPIDRVALAMRGIHGTRVTADRPIAVVGGSAGSFIIHTFLTVPLPAEVFWNYRDVLLEMMRPTDDWEREYRTVPFATAVASPPGDFVRILAACDGTVVDVISASRTRTRNLAAGEAWDLVELDVISRTFTLSPEPLVIRASSPIAVSQYSVGNVAAGVGDPSQLLVPGLARASDTSIVYIPERYDAHVSVVAPAALVAQVLLDGSPLAASWTPYPDGLYSWTRIDGLAAGEHRLSAPGPIAVAVQGSSLTDAGVPDFGAFAYPAPSAGALDTVAARVATDSICTLRCTGQCVPLDAGAGWSSWTWSTGESTPTISFCPTQALETVTVALTDASGCAARGSREVRAREGPTSDAGPAQSLCVSAPVVLGGAPTATLGQPPYTYSWTPAIELDDPALANPTATTSTSRIWTVTVTDAQGCSSSDTVAVDLVTPPAPASLGNSLLAVKRVASVEAGWAADPLATLYHWKQDTAKTQTALVTVLSTALTLDTLAGAVAAPPALAFYQVVAVNCAGIEGP